MSLEGKRLWLPDRASAVARLAGPGNACAVVAESALAKRQLPILNRSRERSPKSASRRSCGRRILRCFDACIRAIRGTCERGHSFACPPIPTSCPDAPLGLPSNSILPPNTLSIGRHLVSVIYLMRVNVKRPTGSLVKQPDLESE
jgi:hypothetical protein